MIFMLTRLFIAIKYQGINNLNLTLKIILLSNFLTNPLFLALIIISMWSNTLKHFDDDNYIL